MVVFMFLSAGQLVESYAYPNSRGLSTAPLASSRGAALASAFLRSDPDESKGVPASINRDFGFSLRRAFCGKLVGDCGRREDGTTECKSDDHKEVAELGPRYARVMWLSSQRATQTLPSLSSHNAGLHMP